MIARGFAATVLALTAAVASLPSAASQPVVAQVWLDDTTSMDLGQRTASVGSLLDELPALTDRHGIDEWHFFGFGEAAWSEMPFHKARFAHWHEPVCAPLAASTGETIFKWKEQRRQAEHQRDCKRDRDATRKTYEAERTRSFAAAVEAVREHRPQPARCTAIGDLLRRIGQDTSPRFVIVISDGSETCERKSVPAALSQPLGVQAVFVLTGSALAQKSESEVFKSRSDSLLRNAPWLTIMAPWGVHDDILAPHPRGVPQSPFGTAGDAASASGQPSAGP